MRRPLIAALLLCAGLVACGSGDEPVSIEAMEPAERAEFLASASTETTEAGSARVFFEMDLGDTGTMTGSGVFDMEEQAGELTFDFGPLAAAMGVPPGTDATAEMISTGLVMYMRMSFLSEAAGLGDKWIRMDLEALGGDLGVDLGQITQAGTNDPTQSLAFLQGSNPDSITEVGQEEITLAGGEGPTVETTHFRATVNLRDAYEQADAVTDAEQFQAFIDQIGTEEIEIEGWVDGKDRVVRMSFAMPIPVQPGSTLNQVGMTMDLYDFGVDVDITEPSEGEYIDIQDLMGAGAGAGAG